MYAIIKAGGKQYKASKDQTLALEKIDAEPGSSVSIGEVLLFCGDDGKVKVGSPIIDGASVTGTILRHGKGKKIIGFTYKAKKNERHHYGHRQPLTFVKVTEIKG